MRQTMGYELEQFLEHIDSSLLCFICKKVVELAKQCQTCQIVFCQKCIDQHLAIRSECPSCSTVAIRDETLRIPHVIVTFLQNLKIKCLFYNDGCSTVITVSDYESHVSNCECNPHKTLDCERCGTKLPILKVDQHDCVRELRSMLVKLEVVLKEQSLKVNQQAKEIISMSKELEELRYKNPEGRRLQSIVLDDIKLKSKITFSKSLEEALLSVDPRNFNFGDPSKHVDRVLWMSKATGLLEKYLKVGSQVLVSGSGPWRYHGYEATVLALMIGKSGSVVDQHSTVDGCDVAEKNIRRDKPFLLEEGRMHIVKHQLSEPYPGRCPYDVIVNLHTTDLNTLQNVFRIVLKPGGVLLSATNKGLSFKWIAFHKTSDDVMKDLECTI